MKLLQSPWDSSSLADWAEAVIFIEGRRRLSRSVLRRRLQARLRIETDVELNSLLDDLLTEIGRRSRIARDGYPFARTDTGITRENVVNESAYEFMLWLAISPTYRAEKRFSEIDKLFDMLVKQAIINYFGEGAKGVRFGSPASGGRPTNFPEAIKWLADLLNLEPGAGMPRSQSRDGGVDVVVWHPFRDRRTGFIVVLCQCTVAYNWPNKSRDIQPRKWSGWIDFAFDPVTALAVPFAIPMTFGQWDELRRTVNFVLDRIRLSELIGGAPVDALENIRVWANGERATLEA